MDVHPIVEMKAKSWCNLLLVWQKGHWMIM